MSGMEHETPEISRHFLSVFTFLRDTKGWHTSKGIAAKANVSDRTARAHLLRLVNLGIADQAEVFPAHRYRFSANAEKRNKAMMTRLKTAEEVLSQE